MERQLQYKIFIIPLSLAITAMILPVAAMIDGYLPESEYNGIYPAIVAYIFGSIVIYGFFLFLMLLIFRNQIRQHIKEKYS